MPDMNGWNEWSKHVLAELERLNDCYERLDSKVTSLREEVVILKVKAAVIGAIAGFVVAAAIKLIDFGGGP